MVGYTFHFHHRLLEFPRLVISPTVREGGQGRDSPCHHLPLTHVTTHGAKIRCQNESQIIIARSIGTARYSYPRNAYPPYCLTIYGIRKSLYQKVFNNSSMTLSLRNMLCFTVDPNSYIHKCIQSHPRTVYPQQKGLFDFRQSGRNAQRQSGQRISRKQQRIVPSGLHHNGLNAYCGNICITPSVEVSVLSLTLVWEGPDPSLRNGLRVHCDVSL